MTLSRIFFFGCLAFIAALAIAPVLNIGQKSILVVFIFGIFFSTIFWRMPRMVTGGIVLLCFGLGLWLYQGVTIKHAQNEVQHFYGQELVFRAKVVDDPEVRSQSMHIVVQPDFVSEGRILLIVREKREVRYADILLVQGKVERPKSFNDFNYEAFLAKDEIYALVREPAFEIEQKDMYENTKEKAMAQLFALKARFRETLETYLPAPHGSLMVEMLLGDKRVMADELAQDLNTTGLRHIIAISGMHIAMLTMYLMPLLILLGLWRQQAFYVTIVLVVFYVLLTGLQSSAFRACVMAGMFLLGQHISRQYAALRALLFAAAGMLLFNPMLLTRDVGFQLSFLAVLGMIFLLAPILSFMPQHLPGRQLIAMTFAAQAFTLPILIWNFGQVSLVSVATNILVVPMVPLLMGLGFVLMILGTFVPVVGLLLSIPVALLVEYILWIVETFSALPFAAMQTENLSPLWLLLFYGAVALLYWKFRKRQQSLVQW